MNILVTGGAGFIGSHIVLDLLNTGKQPVVVDNFANSQPVVLDRIRKLSGKKFDFIEADITDARAMQEVFNSHRIDAVIHLAALKSVEESVRKPLLYHAKNVGGLIELLKAMEEKDCRTLIFSSSATVYGVPQKLPIPEEAPLNSTNPYGSTKIISEYLLQDIAAGNQDWKIISLRYFNPAGAHPSRLLGEMPPQQVAPANLFPAILYAYKNSDYEFKIYGDDYQTKDGTCVRDFIHIMDLSQAHLKALEKCLQPKTQGLTAVNLGSGSGWTVMEVVRTFEEVTGKKLPYKQMPRRPGDIGMNYASIQFAKNFLSWQPQRNLRDMCEDAWRFTESSA